jgi:two-component system, OmpR family, sensor kinase
MLSRLRAVWPLGIRAQLTVLYTAIFASLIVLCGVISYLAFRQSLFVSFDTALQLRTQQIASGISFENGHITIRDVTGGLPGLSPPSPNGQQSTSSQPTPDLPGGEDALPSTVRFGSLVRILDATGHPVYASPGFRALTAPALSISNALHGKYWLGSLSARDGQTVRLYSAGLVDNGQVFGIVQVGEPLDPTASTLQAIVISQILLAPFALVLAALASYWLAARAFHPVTGLTRMAHHIEVDDLHRRVPVPVARDEIRELAITLNEMIERLEHAFAQQRRFVADASHELRTPVATILSLADIQGGTTEEHADALQSIGSEAERLGQLITDLLALARADEGHTVLDAAPVRLDLLAVESTAACETRAAERDIQLTVAADTPVTVLGDEARLIQVAMNLLDNAVAYTEPHGRIDLCVDSQGEWACLTVRDTGRGIAPEELPYIFERFYRTDPARTSGEHSGLGLSIVEWVVRSHQGTVSVESQPGSGSTFTVQLPLMPSSPSRYVLRPHPQDM